MKAVILAGGFGTRLGEETSLKPKPLIEIGGKPILWHLMKIYSHYNINDFIICCGYKGYLIKEYFNNYFLHMSDITFDIEDADSPDALEGDEVQVFEPVSPTDTVLGVEIFPVIHLPTQTKIFVSAEDIKEVGIGDLEL